MQTETLKKPPATQDEKEGRIPLGSIINWIEEGILNEKGEPIDCFKNHRFLHDIFCDQSQNLAVMKAAQIGMTTTEILKNHFDAKRYKLDIIYTMPTDNDVRVMVGGKVNRIIANNPSMLNDVADKDSIEQKAVGDSMIYFRGCVDEETDVLTTNGWKNHEKIKIGEKLPTLNLSTDKVEIQSIIDISKFKINENVISIKNRAIDALLTADHRCVVSNRNGKKKIQRAYELTRHSFIPLQWGKIVPQRADEFAELLGWVISEGSYWTERPKNRFVKRDGTVSPSTLKYPRVCIIQKKYIVRIRKLLELKTGWYEKKHGKNGCLRFELSRRDSVEITKWLPEKKLTFKLIESLPRSSMESLWNGLMFGDGNGKSQFYQVNKESVDAFQYLCVLLGKSSATYLRNFDKYNESVRYSRRPCYRVNVKQSKNSTKFKIERKKYRGIMWCPTTKNGTIFIRRNGKVYVTGQTWTKKAAMMVTADRLVHDEKDASKLDIISDYQARLQHSKYKQTHTFSHPSLPETGIHTDWLKSDQKHWHIKCPHCNHWQYLSWNTTDPSKMSIDLDRKIFACKKCRKEIDDRTRMRGKWVKKYLNKPVSGYWVSLLIAPWISAEYIINKFRDTGTSKEFFYTKILGLPFADASAKLLRQSFFQNLTGKSWAPSTTERVVIGIDTGLRLDYVIGNKNGLFYHGDCDNYNELDGLMKRWTKAIAIIDAGGDLIGSRAFAERWAGRVFVCYLTGTKNKNELAEWGKKEEHGSVNVDRNRIIQLVIDEFREKRIPVHGTQDEWYEYWLDWNNLSKLKVLDPDTNEDRGYKWVRSGRDHRALATAFWRVGMMRFAGMGAIDMPASEPKPNSYYIEPNQTAKFNPEELFDWIEAQKTDDWRNV